MEILYRIICVVIGYIFGMFQTGYIYGKLHHIDIRDYGSHNSGTTNVSRIFGKKVGTLTYFVDAIKGVLAILLVLIYLLRQMQTHSYTFLHYIQVSVLCLDTIIRSIWDLKAVRELLHLQVLSSECFTGRFSGSALFCFLEQHFRVNMFHLALSR